MPVFKGKESINCPIFISLKLKVVSQAELEVMVDEYSLVGHTTEVFCELDYSSSYMTIVSPMSLRLAALSYKDWAAIAKLRAICASFVFGLMRTAT